MISIKGSSCAFRARWVFRSHRYCSENGMLQANYYSCDWLDHRCFVSYGSCDRLLTPLSGCSVTSWYFCWPTDARIYSLSLTFSLSHYLTSLSFLCYGFWNVSACVWNVKSLNVELVGNVKERRGIKAECPFSDLNIFTRVLQTASVTLNETFNWIIVLLTISLEALECVWHKLNHGELRIFSKQGFWSDSHSKLSYDFIRLSRESRGPL